MPSQRHLLAKAAKPPNDHSLNKFFCGKYSRAADFEWYKFFKIAWKPISGEGAGFVETVKAPFSERAVVPPRWSGPNPYGCAPRR